MIVCSTNWRVLISTFAGILLCASAYGEAYYMPLPGEDVIGDNVQVKARGGDTLLTIGNRYGIGMHEMLEANQQLGLTGANAHNRLRSGKKVTVPKQFVLPPFRKGIVINLPEARLYYFSSDGQYVYTYPVGLGRMAWRTPITKTSVIGKEIDPTWNVPKSIRKHVLETTGKNLPSSVPPGPDNPLGKYAMRLGAGSGSYLIHGTNQPWTIGKFVSSGCIRMHNNDVEELYQMVANGTSVRIINYPQKAGWRGGQLYLESQSPVDINASVSSLNPGSAKAVITKAAKSRGAAIDWGKADGVVSRSDGLPQPIGSAYGIGSLSMENSLY